MQHGRGSPPCSASGAEATLNSSKSTLKATAAEFVPAIIRRLVSTSATSTGSGEGTYTPMPGEMCQGQLVTYQRDRDTTLQVALLLDPCGKKNWTALTTRGQKISLTPQQILVVLPGGPYTEADLQLVAQEAAGLARDYALIELAWELSNVSMTYTVPEMAMMLFGDEASPGSCAAAHSLLSSQRTFFKQSSRTPPTFKARLSADVTAVRAQEEKALQEKEELNNFKAFFVEQTAKLRATPATLHKADLERSKYVDKLLALEQFALQTPESFAGPSAAAQLALKALSANATPESAAGVLRSVGWWRRHDTVELLRTGLTTHFSPDLQEAVTFIQDGLVDDADAVNRVNLQSHDIFTIDDISTTEIDDGLSAQKLPDGRWKVWVHIADPTRWLGSPDVPLFKEAARRSKSVYLPTGVIPMFPRALAEDSFSLRSNVGPVEAMSISATVGDDGSLTEYEIVPSYIEPKLRLTYDQADAVIAGSVGQPADAVNEALIALYQVALRRREWRLAQGAVEFSMPDVNVRVDLDADDTIRDISIETYQTKDSASNTLVSEMMVLAGEIVGDYGIKAGLPLPYRSQADPVLPTEDEMSALPEGVCRAIALRNRMTRSITSAEASRHASLGLPSYVQFTSPIRRFGDLIAHAQVKAHIRGQQLPYTAEALMAALEDCNSTTRELQAAERAATAYWHAQFFRRQPAGTLYGGQLVAWRRQETGAAKVILDLGLEILITLNRPAAVGERVTLQLTSFTPTLIFREAPAQKANLAAAASPPWDQKPHDVGLPPTAVMENVAFLATLPVNHGTRPSARQQLG